MGAALARSPERVLDSGFDIPWMCRWVVSSDLPKQVQLEQLVDRRRLMVRVQEERPDLAEAASACISGIDDTIAIAAKKSN